MEPDPKAAIAIHGPAPPKKRRSLRFIRALLVLINGRSNKTRKSMKVEVVASSELLNRVVGTMRPLHAPQNRSVLPSDSPRVSLTVLSLEGVEMKPSSNCSSFLTVSEGGNSPEYESPMNNLGSENAVEEFGDGDRDGGDEMIDAKADEFIARFYEQIRIQN